jgi:hypothetical protein
MAARAEDEWTAPFGALNRLTIADSIARKRIGAFTRVVHAQREFHSALLPVISGTP